MPRMTIVFLKLNLIYTSGFGLKSYVNSIQVFIEGKLIFKVLFRIFSRQFPLQRQSPRAFSIKNAKSVFTPVWLSSDWALIPVSGIAVGLKDDDGLGNSETVPLVCPLCSRPRNGTLIDEEIDQEKKKAWA